MVVNLCMVSSVMIILVLNIGFVQCIHCNTGLTIINLFYLLGVLPRWDFLDSIGLKCLYKALAALKSQFGCVVALSVN